MKYQKAIERIRDSGMSRADLARLKTNAEKKLTAGDIEAKAVLDEIDNATPLDSYVLFMGFCPNADFSERLDIEWKAEGICRFEYLESEHQAERFNSICKGDLVVLKKREKFGKTMNLYGHGRVLSIAHDETNTRYFKMDWSAQDEVIEVPLVGCNSTVDVKSMAMIEREMPEEFYDWLKA